MGYHMTRKTISAIKSNLHPHCNETDTGFFNSSFVPSIPISNITPRVVGASGQFEFEWSNATLPDFVVCPAGWPPFDTKVEGEAELGALDYCFLFAYAVAMFVSGFIADRTPLRYYLTIGMMGVVITTVAFGVGFFVNIHSIAYYIVVQILGGIAQSTGWPGVVAVMANWFGKGNRGFIMGLWNTHTSIGNILGTIIPGAVQQHGWGWAFVSTAGIMFVITVMIFFLLPSEPAVVGLKQPNTDQQSSKVQAVSSFSASINETLNDDSLATADTLLRNANANQNANAPQKGKAISFWRALFIPGVVEYSLALFFAKLVAYTFLFWLPFYIKNNSGTLKLTNFEADWISTFFDIGGIFGSILIGLISDIFKSRAIPTFVFLILSIPMLFVYEGFGKESTLLAIILVALTGFFVNAPYAIITTAISADLGTHESLKDNHKAKATVTAIIDGTGSIGAALGPLITGWIGTKNWSYVFYLLMGSCFLSAVFTIRLVFSEILKLYRFIKGKRTGHTYSLLNTTDDEQVNE
jgi:OPA family glycerol-3-phosphate transporter-like MFS transporter 1/2